MWTAVLTLGGLGVGFGLLLAVASRVFAVETDERLEALISALPGANCGGCGYAGCSTFAAMVLEGKAPVGGCPVGGSDVTENVARISGRRVTKNKRMTALVRCSGGERALRKFAYEGLSDCVAAMKVGGDGPMACSYGCIGLGTCVNTCPFGAISLRDGVARVDFEKCTGCMRCVPACPKHIIVPVPYEADIVVACASRDRGPVLRKYCEIGCLGCKICEKTCEYDAIKVADSLATIDYDKCTSCGECAEKCPRKLIVDAKLR